MNTSKQKKTDDPVFLVCLIFLIFGVVVLIPLFPPFGLLWCGILGKAMYSLTKKAKGEGGSGAARPDWEQLKRTGQEAKVKYLRHVKAEDAAEERVHSHTPVAYSYDECAREKRLEQLDVLKDAGLLDDVEYQRRRQEILAMRTGR